MVKVLVVTGPLVAWLDKGDGDHLRCATFFANYQGQRITTWPVLTDVCHLLPCPIVGRFMRWVAAGRGYGKCRPRRRMTSPFSWKKYDDLPMDLADASLVWLAAQAGIVEVIALDETDFGIYRLPGGKGLTNLLAR